MSSTVVEKTTHLPLSFSWTILECQPAKEAWASFYALGPVIVTQLPGWTPEDGSFATGHEVRWCPLSSPFHNCPYSSPLYVHTNYPVCVFLHGDWQDADRAHPGCMDHQEHPALALSVQLGHTLPSGKSSGQLQVFSVKAAAFPLGKVMGIQLPVGTFDNYIV